MCTQNEKITEAVLKNPRRAMTSESAKVHFASQRLLAKDKPELRGKPEAAEDGELL